MASREDVAGWPGRLARNLRWSKCGPFRPIQSRDLCFAVVLQDSKLAPNLRFTVWQWIPFTVRLTFLTQGCSQNRGEPLAMFTGRPVPKKPNFFALTVQCAVQ